MTTAVDTLGGALADWLPRQRWYAGKDRSPTTVHIERTTTLLHGDPTLLHLLVAVDGELYQLLLGRRPQLPAELADAWICDTTAGVLYAAVHDSELMSPLLSKLRHNPDGPVFEPEPGARIDYELPARVVSAEQSNTSLIFGDRHVLKLFRRVLTGPHPDIDLHRALHSVGAQHIARMLGTITAEIDGSPAALGIVQEFLPDAEDGWTLATTGDHAAFTTQATELGRSVAHVHAALARAFGPHNIAVDDLDDTADRLHRRLTALGEGIPELAPHEAALREAFDRLRTTRGPFVLQRVHGDLHLGQALRAAGRWTLIDFEGEPGRPLAERNAHRHPLQDVATMLRSFDYAAHHGDHPDPGRAPRLRAAFCDGYAETLDDPRDHPTLLHALELDKAVYEVAYERAHRPEWTHLPLGAITRILEGRT
ncbi:maltokinase N-terminal cap-like domain-containing protein [Actinosynnema sp. CS-041913]|uniref:maltokinase N-terminal cap-like domain-containing protein n=1 Tax=Actinosynnema sp. CS-041913 TaxID=3239917 RepID=UPI003D8E2BF8